MTTPYRAKHQHKVKAPTERSEQKVQGHAPGQGQGVKPLVGTGQSPVGVNFLFDFAHKKWAEPHSATAD